MYSAEFDVLDPDRSSGSIDNRPVLSRTAKVLATERSAKDILCAGDCRYRIPTGSQRKALLIGFAMCGKALAGASFDAVRLEGDVDLDDCDDIALHNERIVLIELKSTNQEKIGSDLSGYFFNITAAEMTTAQALKGQYRFAFLNTVRGDWQELSLSDVMARAKAIYPAFHIRL